MTSVNAPPLMDGDDELARSHYRLPSNQASDEAELDAVQAHLRRPLRLPVASPFRRTPSRAQATDSPTPPSIAHRRPSSEDAPWEPPAFDHLEARPTRSAAVMLAVRKAGRLAAHGHPHGNQRREMERKAKGQGKSVELEQRAEDSDRSALERHDTFSSFSRALSTRRESFNRRTDELSRSHTGGSSFQNSSLSSPATPLLRSRPSLTPSPSHADDAPDAPPQAPSASSSSSLHPAPPPLTSSGPSYQRPNHLARLDSGEPLVTLPQPNHDRDTPHMDAKLQQSEAEAEPKVAPFDLEPDERPSQLDQIDLEAAGVVDPDQPGAPPEVLEKKRQEEVEAGLKPEFESPQEKASKGEVVWERLWENQRGILFFGAPRYSALSLLPMDPSPFTRPGETSRKCRTPYNLRTFQLPDGTWTWCSEWMVNMRLDGQTDEKGWQYNWIFRSKGWHAVLPWHGWKGWVRRREWIRLRIHPPPPPTPLPSANLDLPSDPADSSLPSSSGPSTSASSRKGSDVPYLSTDDALRKLGTLSLDRERLDVWSHWLDLADHETARPKSAQSLVEEHGETIQRLFTHPSSRVEFAELIGRTHPDWQLPAPPQIGSSFSHRSTSDDPPVVHDRAGSSIGLSLSVHG